jgi:hypothetical protein
MSQYAGENSVSGETGRLLASLGVTSCVYSYIVMNWICNVAHISVGLSVSHTYLYKINTSLSFYLFTPPSFSKPVCCRKNDNYKSCFLGIFFSRGAATQLGPLPPHSRGFLITHNDAPQSVGLLWTSDQPVAETST